MPANNVIEVSDINFDQIKTNLKSFLSDQNEFSDYDFDSSTMSILLDLLSYNTYYNAFYLNMVGNEMFLDSAQLRNSVVSRAKQLNYVPRSARGAKAVLNVSVDPAGSPSFYTIAANTKFTTSIDGVNYTFVTPEATSLTLQSNGTFTGTLNITQGEPLQQRFTVSTSTPTRYILPNPNVDTTSLTVRTQESSSDTTLTTWSTVSDFSSVNSVSTIYFLQENEDSKFEVYFGDNVYGKKPKNGNIVIIDYRVVDGSVVNGANTFSGSFSVTSNTAASGGAELESMSSIKYNAPFKFQAQDRLVTSNDYKNIILSENGDIQAISVWGGEENNPPVYGKVYISVKPKVGSVISSSRKQTLKTFLKTRNVVSIDTDFVDATYLYVNPKIDVRYDPQLTSLSASELNTKIQNAISSFESNNLGVFSNKFYSSVLSDNVKKADTSFVTSDLSFTIEKRFVPITTSTNTYELEYNNVLSNPHSGHLGNVSSSKFVVDGNEVYIDENGKGTLRIYSVVNNERVYRDNNFGKIDYSKGILTIYNTLITSYSGTSISVFVTPENKNIFGVRNQIILVSGSSVTTVDNSTGIVTSAAGGSEVVTQGTTTTILTDNAVPTFGLSSSTVIATGTTTSTSISGSSY